MKQKFITPLKVIVLMLLTAVSLSSCEEDDWYYVSDTVRGRWEVVDIGYYDGECPYHYGDEMMFYGNGYYEGRGYGNFYEHGYWDLSHNCVVIDFDDDGRYDLKGSIRQLDDYVMELDVRDYSYGSRYVLRLMRL